MTDNRREFIKKGGALAALSLVGLNTNKADIFGKAENKEILSEEGSKSSSGKPLMKIAYQASPEPGEDDIKFIQQMGIDQVVLWTNSKNASYEYYASRRQLVRIAEYKKHLRNLGKAGITYTTYAHMANGIWSTKGGKTRGDASARSFDLENATGGNWIEKR